VGLRTLAEAEGSTKKLAQQEAARLALAGLAAPAGRAGKAKAAQVVHAAGEVER